MPQAARPTKDIVINGRFLTQPLSGVQRYAREITRALDKLVAADPTGLGRRRWRLVLPSGADCDLDLLAIAPETIGHRQGHAWEQFDLWRGARSSRLLSLGNSGPLLHDDQLVVIHDAAPFRTPANFSRRYALAHRTLGRLLARTAQLATVSEFSRSELATVLHVPAAGITVAPNGADHLLDRPRSADVVSRLGLRPGRFFLFVGSPTPNKNLPIALEAFRRLDVDDAQFVIAGSLNCAVFGGTAPDTISGVQVASGLPDADVVGLYTAAAALVFPTRYEGFGIPPLEAMACGCPVIASDLPVTREVCGAAADFFSPGDTDMLSERMAAALAGDKRFPSATAAERVARYTWARSANILAQAIL